MLGKLFRKKEKVGSLFAPITGKVIKMEDVPDKMFNEKCMVMELRSSKQKVL
ncbi:hypothetical protein [Caldifermentibacillus hisashii]|uniref:hypothetical protein n=1 Tax=Caldifermentibacillus hisashii TaxID=996558 RepID=UPI0030D69364